MPKKISRAEVPEGEGRTVEVDGTVVAVFNVDGRYYALDGVCPHAGGPLGDGFLTGTVVTCPWHGWQFDVTTGACTFSPDIAQSRCEVRENGDYLEIDAPIS